MAKQMIAEGGESSFTIRDLASRANVSVTTIYAAFGDKKGLIAAAIEDYYEDLPIAHAIPTTSLSALLAFNDEVREAILANKPYAREYAELYFSNNLDPRIFKVNLIPYNPTDSPYAGSGRQAIASFKAALEEQGLPATVRLTRGRDIDAACGQLAGRVATA